MKVGAWYNKGGTCDFVAWAPLLKNVSIEIVSQEGRTLSMKSQSGGYWKGCADGILPGDLYQYQLGCQKSFPDPASHFQPQGVHGPSQIIDHQSFQWKDASWQGIPLSEMILYELHVGTFSPEGTFEAIIPRLIEFRETGINAIELMPVTQFPGNRNWGYDGVYPFAVQNTYGGPEGLKKLVDACHHLEISVVLDVVYNHLGPEGNYLRQFGPYFTEKYRTPWGPALNFDDAYSEGVQNFFLENALFWFREYHIDALRLDAVHAILDQGAIPFLQRLADATKAYTHDSGKKHYLIAESDLNDARILRPHELGGLGIHAQWCDDFHHGLQALLTANTQGYYMDYGTLKQMGKAYRNGFIYTGQYSHYRKKSYGNSAKDRPGDQFVVFSQNHDQIGNRPDGKRLSTMVSYEALKLAAGVVLFAPYIPLLFMGEEYAEDSPFLYFVEHTDSELIKAVQKGRKRESRAFGWKKDPPDPQDQETFHQSKIHWEKRNQGHHRVMVEFYRTLIHLRKTLPSLRALNKEDMEVWVHEADQTLYVNRWAEQSQTLCIFNFSPLDHTIELPPLKRGKWELALDSADEQWNGPGSLLPETIHGTSAVLFHQSD